MSLERRLAALLAVSAAAALSPTLFCGFVHDDHASVLGSELVKTPGAWTRAFTEPSDAYGYVRPLRTIEFAFDWWLGGGAPFVFHLHSVLWHVVATLTLFALLRRLLPDVRSAAVAALLWAVHPVQVEPVAWISSRGDMAMGACVFGSLLFALRAQGWGRDLAMSLALAALAVLYKETALALPLAVLALRLTGFSRAPVWPYVLVAAAFLGWRAMAAPPKQDLGFVLGGSFIGTVATMSRAFGWYVLETLLPAQSLDWYMTPSSTFDLAALTWLAAHVALLGWAWTARKRAPLLALGVFVFYVFLSPVANWPLPVGKPTSERYLYVSLAGAAFAVGGTLVGRRALLAPLGVVAAAFVALTIDRAGMWRDDDSLMGAVLADHESPGARFYFSGERRDQGLRRLEEAAKLPEGPERKAAQDAAQALFEESLVHAEAAVAVWRGYDPSPTSTSPVLRNFELAASRVAFLARRNDEALRHAEAASRIAVDPESEFHRGRALAALGFAPHAIDALGRALEAGYRPADAASVLVAAGDACQEQGLFVAAERAYRVVAAHGPDQSARADAVARLDRLLALPRPASAEADERERLRALDEDLARRLGSKL
jgi:tetratricopeptide (TPR) repeat protein